MTTRERELEAALRDVLFFCRLLPAEGWAEFSDRLAERFYRETGVMAPGKSVPIAMEPHASDEERADKFQAWRDGYFARARSLLGASGSEDAEGGK